MEMVFTLLSFVASFISFILVLRAWLEFCRVDPRLPLSQTLIRLTQPLLSLPAKFIPNVKQVNVVALLLAALVMALFFWIVGNPVQIAVLVGVLSVVKTFGQILFFTTLIRALMSWVTQGNHPLDYVVAQITEPVLGLIRRLLPRTGMLDFSVMVLGFILILLNSLMYNIFGAFWAAA
ncbi:hypothetical protein A4G20_01805 [Pasteurellaceae bacterium RH1A]|nr:hypothetical protein A4G20_01805 [Pasteurellaceae bacterium RH1A]